MFWHKVDFFMIGVDPQIAFVWSTIISPGQYIFHIIQPTQEKLEG